MTIGRVDCGTTTAREHETAVPIGAVEIPRGRIAYAPAVRAGRWVFLTGLNATDFVTGVAPEVLRWGLPLAGLPKVQTESAYVLNRLEQLLNEAGADLSRVVRLDQYYRRPGSVDGYHTVRAKRFGKNIPASTSVVVEQLVLSEAEIDVQALAVIASEDFQIDALHPPGHYVPEESGYKPAVCAGGFVFLAGQLARGPDGNIAPDACVPVNQLWKGTQIKKETEYLIREKIEPALRAAGSSSSGAVKAQVYLSDVNDLPGFREVWNAHFPPESRPATTYVPVAVPGFGTAGAHVEVNLIALQNEVIDRRVCVEPSVYTGFDGDCPAVAAEDLLFVSGLMAVDESGVVPGAQPDPRQPYFGSSIAEQMRCIIDKAERLCSAADTSLENLVRVQQFHTDLREFQAAYEIWRERLRGRPLPFSAVQVPAPLPVPGCSVLVDLWVFRPRFWELRSHQRECK